jgi:hypothetical protein
MKERKKERKNERKKEDRQILYAYFNEEFRNDPRSLAENCEENKNMQTQKKYICLIKNGIFFLLNNF